jgi:DnaJ-class molecular chaperone
VLLDGVEDIACRPMADHYEVLQVSKDDPHDIVKAAYHRLALLNHPDKTSRVGAAEIFRQVTEAWSVLGDGASRADYDRVLFEEEQIGANAESVCLSEFCHADGLYSKTCRCGSTYEVSVRT